MTGWGETVYNVSVGGTDFEDTYNAAKGSPAIQVSTYWNSTDTGTDSSAKSYIPEIPWNDSCAGYLLYNYLGYASDWPVFECHVPKYRGRIGRTEQLCHGRRRGRPDHLCRRGRKLCGICQAHLAIWNFRKSS